MALRLQDDDAELSEINVTPFIDVILVLLIVFMVAAPLSTVDVPVNLPASRAPAQDRPQDPVWVTLTADRRLLVAETATGTAALGAALDARTGGQRDVPVFLRADRSIVYTDLMAVLDALRGAGYLRVALVGLGGGP